MQRNKKICATGFEIYVYPVMCRVGDVKIIKMQLLTSIFLFVSLQLHLRMSTLYDTVAFIENNQNQLMEIESTMN